MGCLSPTAEASPTEKWTAPSSLKIEAPYQEMIITKKNPYVENYN